LVVVVVVMSYLDQSDVVCQTFHFTPSSLPSPLSPPFILLMVTDIVLAEVDSTVKRRITTYRSAYIKAIRHATTTPPLPTGLEVVSTTTTISSTTTTILDALTKATACTASDEDMASAASSLSVMTREVVASLPLLEVDSIMEVSSRLVLSGLTQEQATSSNGNTTTTTTTTTSWDKGREVMMRLLEVWSWVGYEWVRDEEKEYKGGCYLNG